MDKLVNRDENMRVALIGQAVKMMCWASNTIIKADAFKEELPDDIWIRAELKKSSKKALKLLHLTSALIQNEPHLGDEGFRNCFEDISKKYKKQKKKWEHSEVSAKNIIKEQNKDVF